MPNGAPIGAPGPIGGLEGIGTRIRIPPGLPGIGAPGGMGGGCTLEGCGRGGRSAKISGGGAGLASGETGPPGYGRG